jgi:hypothetical protein
MQEFWFCEACKSMNRGDAANCYRCRAPKAHTTMATVHEQRLEDVLVPGVHQLEQSQAAALLNTYSYAAAWQIGYVSAALLLLPIVFEIGLIAVCLANIVAMLAPQVYSTGSALEQLWPVCLVGYIATLLLAGALHSVFLSIADANVPSLGGGQPRFGPLRAGSWWIESAGWALRAILAVWAPVLIGLQFMNAMSYFGFLAAFGLLFGLAMIWVSIRVFGSPMEALSKPARLLDDLTKRLSVPGSPSGLVSIWSGAWGTARLVDTLAPLAVLGTYLVLIVLAVVDFMRAAGGAGPLLDIWSLVAAAAFLLEASAVLQLGADLIALVLLIVITLSLCASEKVRRHWVVESAGLLSGHYPIGNPGGTPSAVAYHGFARPPWTLVEPKPATPIPWIAAVTPATPLEPQPQPEPEWEAISPAPAPSSAVLVPRWIRTRAEVLGEAADVEPVAPVADEPPLADEPAPAPVKRILRPSMSVVPLYALPPRAKAPAPAPGTVDPDPPASAAAQPLAAERPEAPPNLAADWPEGM